MKIILFENRFRDDLIFMILEAKNALGRVPGLNEDLLDIKKNYIDRGGNFWIAVDDDNRVIGSIGMIPTENSDECFFHRLFVKCNMKNKGIGSELLRTAEEFAKENGKKTAVVHLGSPKEQWFESWKFYPKNGYVLYDDCLMKKTL